MGVGFCVFWAVGLHICVVGASLDTIALPAECLFKSLYPTKCHFSNSWAPRGRPWLVKALKIRPSNLQEL